MLELRDVEVLNGLSDRQLQTFGKLFSNIVRAERSDQIIRKGTPSQTMFAILEGSVIVHVAGRKIQIEAGDLVGEINAYSPGQAIRTAEVIAGDDGATILAIPKKLLYLLKVNHPDLARFIVYNIAFLIAIRLAGMTSAVLDEQKTVMEFGGNIAKIMAELSKSFFTATRHLLGGLAEEEAEYVRQKFPETTYEPQTQVIFRGETSQDMLEIVDGSALVVDITTLVDGDVLGEIGFITGTPRTANVFAGPNGLKARIFTRSQFSEFSEEMPKTAGQIIENLTEALALRHRATLTVLEQLHSEAIRLTPAQGRLIDKLLHALNRRPSKIV